MPPRSYKDGHPNEAYLIVEVAETSLAYDRATKAPLYAQSGVPEYWIVDVGGGAVEAHDQPAGGLYRRCRRFDRGATLSPARFPDVAVAVSALLD